MEGDSSEDDTATNCVYYLSTDDMSIYRAYLRRVLRRGYAFLRKFSILSWWNVVDSEQWTVDREWGFLRVTQFEVDNNLTQKSPSDWK